MSSTLAFPILDPDHFDPSRDSTTDGHDSLSTVDAAAPPSSNPQDAYQGSLSPNTLNHTETPGASSSALSCYSDLDEDPFFGAALGPTDGVPSVFDDEPAGWQSMSHTSTATHFSIADAIADSPAHDADSLYPLTPDQTVSVQSASPNSDRRSTITRSPQLQPTFSISPQELQKPFRPEPIVTHQPQLTPSQSNSARSSEDGLAPTPAPVRMPAQSPRVTVSVWDDQDDSSPSHAVERSFDDEHGPHAARHGIQSAGDLISSGGHTSTSAASAPRDASGRWQRDPFTGQAGLGPASRVADETPSINDLANRRKSDERNEEVGRWLSGNLDEVSVPREGAEEKLRALEQLRTDSDDGVPLGDATENRQVPGQTYYAPTGGSMNDVDYDIISRDRNWSNAPMLPQIMRGRSGHNQPETSQAAIERFERMWRDNDSIISRQATWGTRRRSIQSTVDLDGVVSGSFLKKLSISKSPDLSNRVGGFLEEIRGFVRRPSLSSLRKRRGSNAGSDDGRGDDESPASPEKRDSLTSPHLAPPGRSASRGRKPKSNVNTGASGGSGHSRKSSIGAMSMASPKNFIQSLKVENTLQRPRSRSEAPKPTITTDTGDTHRNLIGMWRASGGPPVASLAGRPSTSTQPDMDADGDVDGDDDDEDDEEGVRGGGGVGILNETVNPIDSITPNFAGFQEHVRMLNPDMGPEHDYLIDRIAHQQTVRYKTLLGLRVKHLGLGANCPCGPLCIALGGQAKVLDQKGHDKGLDPLAASRLVADDDDGDDGAGNGQGDGAINQDSFPQDIPMPPTQRLPAELECQLCFASKKFNKPSDWTKHVHEDVQPFTCTWDRCRDAKSFKRKADWVRHENEGHRHLEWWTCDVEECRHTCYRRDNFLQHLVREHKFREPSVKTKAAIKKSGGADPTWKKVEDCHVINQRRPQDEPCRFCGRTCPTWKKLTVHLAKHMEQVSLPVLRLVEAKAKEIDADTIISPVQDPPPRQAFIPPPVQNQIQGGIATGPLYPYDVRDNQVQPVYGTVNPYGMYSVIPPQFGGQPPQGAQYDNMVLAMQRQQQMNQNTMGMGMGMGQMDHGFNTTSGGQMPDLTATSGPYHQGSGSYMTVPSTGDADGSSGVEPFPPLADGLGLDSASMGGMASGGNMGYGNNMMDPSTASASPFSGQGSASPYSHSPHQNAATDQNWDGRRMYGFH